jgi:hypothetical protein
MNVPATQKSKQEHFKNNKLKSKLIKAVDPEKIYGKKRR